MHPTVVPVIYDHNTKQVIRWYLLDFESQRTDPAFNPTHPNEKLLNIPLSLYKTFGKTSTGLPSYIDLQNYVQANTP